MTVSSTAILIVSPNRWFRRSFGQYARMAYADTEVHEQDVYELDEGLTTQTGLVIVDVAGTSSGVIHRLPVQYSEQTEAVIEQKWVAVIPYVNDELTDSLLFAGYTGVIVKAVPPQTIVHSFEMLSKGGVVRPAPSKSTVSGDIPDAIMNVLSQQEIDLYRLLLTGRSIASIARELSISEKECVASARRIMNSIRRAGSKVT